MNYDEAISKATQIAKSQGNPYPSVDWARSKEQGVAEGSEEKHDFIPVKLLKRNVPYWLTYDFYGHGGKLVKLSGPYPTNNNFIIVKDQDGNEYSVSKKAVLFASDPNQNKGREQGVAEGFGLRGTGNPGMPTPYDQGRADAKKGRPYDNPYDQPGEEQEHRNYRKGYDQNKGQCRER